MSDPDDNVEEPVSSRTPTKPIPPIQCGRIEVDLEDPEAVAGFLELVARIVRDKRRLVLIVE